MGIFGNGWDWMNKTEARQLADTITNEELKQMFDNAKSGITNWGKVSRLNKGLTKGAVWNLMASNFDPGTNYQPLAKRNMILEFDEYLPEYLKVVRDPMPKNKIKVHHEDPIF